MTIPEDSVARLVRDAERALDEMIELQRAKVARKAQEALPGCSWEEMMNPDGVPALRADPLFNYEDGTLSGLIAAQIALRSRVFHPESRGRAADGPLPSLHD